MSTIDFTNLQHHQLMDSLHDFGKLSTCYDSLTYNRNDGKCSTEKMMFTYLAMYTFTGIDNNEFLKNYSNLTTHLGKLPSQLQPKDLENNFLNEAKTPKQKGTFKEYKKDFKTLDRCTELQTLFGKYKNNGKIYLIVDTQKTLYECIKLNKEETIFATVITRESVYDPANKIDINQPALWQTKFRDEAVLIETDNKPREYSGKNIVGNFNITLSAINAKPGDTHISFQIKENTTLIVKNDNCKMNSASNHPNCISYLNKNIIAEIKNINKKNVERACPSTLMNVSNFYTDNGGFVNYTNINISNDNKTKIKKLCAFFTQKRLGDALQAEVCLRSQTNPIICRNLDNNADINVKNAILVTIDRMLFAYAVLRNVPVIYDSGHYMLCFVPSDEISGGIVSENSTSIIGGNPKIPKSGGAVTRSIQNVISQDNIDQIFTEPTIFFNILPFVFINPNLLGDSTKTYVNQIIPRYKDLLQQISKTPVITIRDNVLLEQPNEPTNRKTNNNNCLTFNYDDLKTHFDDPISSNKSKLYVLLKVNNVIKLFSEKPDDNTITFCFNTGAQKPNYKTLKNDSALSGSLSGINDIEQIIELLDISVFEQIDEKEDYDEVNKPRSIVIANDTKLDINLTFFQQFVFVLALVSAILGFIYLYYPSSSLKKNGGGKPENFKEFIEQLREQHKDVPAPIFTDKLIQPINTAILFSYLWMFRMYELKVCFDDEQLKLDYDDSSPNSPGEYYVPTHKMPYLLFKRLIDDYDKEKDKVSYIFIERILHELDSSLYTRINEIKYVVMMDDYVDDDVMNNPMLNKMIEANTELYEYTKGYLTVIIDEITTIVNRFDKNISIAYNDYPNALLKYCIDFVKLNKYSFLYMYTDFTNTVFTQPITPIKFKTGIDIGLKSSLEQPNQYPVMAGVGGKKKKHIRKLSKKRKISYKRKTIKK
jgi:hypothetical protein